MWSKKGKEIKDERVLSTINAIFSNKNKGSKELYQICPVKVDNKKERIKIIDAKKGKHKGKVSTILNEKFEIG